MTNKTINNELTQICIELNGRTEIIGWCNEYIHDKDNINTQEIYTVFLRRREEIFQLAQAQEKFDQLAKQYDLNELINII
jgi:hypothetical protein